MKNYTLDEENEFLRKKIALLLKDRDYLIDALRWNVKTFVMEDYESEQDYDSYMNSILCNLESLDEL